MALVTNLVWILFVASVQCSYQQWHSNSFNNQNQNTNGDSNENNKQPWIINQASVQNVPMWRDFALSTEQTKQTISNRLPDTQSNTNSQRDWYKPDQQSSQDIQLDMSNKPILQPNVNTNLWHKIPVSDILLTEWTDVNPTADEKQEMKQHLSLNPWNQLQMSVNQMQSESNKYLPPTNIKFGHDTNIHESTTTHVNMWKPVRGSKLMNMQEQISMKPKQINKPQLQASPSMNTWNQADKGNDISSWFSSQISAPEENHPKLQSTTPKLESDTKAWNQISGEIVSSTWNNNGNSVHEVGQNIITNTMPWNQIEAENKPLGWYINDNVSEMNEPDQLNNNVYGVNQIAAGNEPSGWFTSMNGNLPEKNQPDQNVKLGLEFNANVNKWNQEVAENILAGWYNIGEIKNDLQSNNNMQSNINHSMQNPIHSDKSFTKIETMPPSPYLTVPQVTQPYNTLEPLKVDVSMKVPHIVPIYQNNNVGTRPNTIMLVPKYW